MTRTNPAEAGPDQVGTCGQDTPADCAVTLAHEAIEANRIAECETHLLIAVADVVMVEAAANGHAHLDTFRLGRADGRTAAICRLPDPVVFR